MKPTQEQHGAIEMATSGEDFKISAYAGTGKTSTLKLIGKVLNNQSGMYLAFNKAIATEAASKFDRNVSCKTFHSMAFRQSPRYITEKLSNPRLLPMKMAKSFDLRDYKVPLAIDNEKSANCTPYDQAMILNRALGYFCRSTSDHITHDIMMRSMPDWAEKQYCADLAQGLIDKANSLWNMSIDQRTSIKISHDVYLKHWAMNNPTIDSDFILFDEAQDADPIMLDVLSKQDAQVIYVGDRHQQIYAFRGAVNAMQSLRIPETLLTKSFRFGNEIANTANSILFTLLDETKPLVGNELIQSNIRELSHADAYLARTNAGAFKKALQLIGEGRSPALSIDLQALHTQVCDAENLQEGLPPSKTSEFFGFSKWDEVLTYTEENSACDLAPIVSLIENNGTAFLKEVIEKTTKPSQHDCMISTAHKSKGLEFSGVKLCDDYNWNDKKDNEPLMSADEARLFYVACTRAINHLDTSDMSKFFQKLTKYNKFKQAA